MDKERLQGVRAISFEEASASLRTRLDVSPELMGEVLKLAGGNPGVVEAVLYTCVEYITYDPTSEATPERIRRLVGAPTDDAELANWRQPFYDAYTQARMDP
jgi:hypothetical protein